MFAGPIDWAKVAQQNQEMKQERATADTTRAQTERMGLASEIGLRKAQAGLYGAQTGEVAADSASERALRAAQGGFLGVQTQFYPQDIMSQVGLRQSETRRNDYRITPEAAEAALSANTGVDMSPATRRLSGVSDELMAPITSGAGLSFGKFGFAKGTAMVPGKGTGKVDTVPAKLAPGEAVLNKAAAEAMGRGLIAALNAAGARKMGMV